MGYYATATELVFTIPADKVQEATNRVDEITRLFPERAKNLFYPADAKTNLEEMFIEFGFEIEDADGGIGLVGFDQKWHGEDEVLHLFADLVDEDSFINFVGEDHDMWRWTPKGTKTATITWS
jgi:hypothetical protein